MHSTVISISENLEKSCAFWHILPNLMPMTAFQRNTDAIPFFEHYTFKICVSFWKIVSLCSSSEPEFTGFKLNILLPQTLGAVYTHTPPHTTTLWSFQQHPPYTNLTYCIHLYRFFKDLFLFCVHRCFAAYRAHEDQKRASSRTEHHQLWATKWMLRSKTRSSVRRVSILSL